ncbi:MAG: UDP-N-acetylmuramoyl-L-alanyl-D-glutamate--2,6-diaminopimelate ligase [Ilumatobacteraceae bacterium]|nr:UDP-N-acetylmuramoyl-L-alanyl-D-glutamate--2,6-diaminopimelate ligase [Ilumatobacteraceae bacterium]
MNERTVSAETVAAAIPPSIVLEVIGAATDIVDLTHDSRDVRPGVGFACVVGDRSDGHDFAAQAVEDGATMLIASRRLPLDVAQILVTDVRRAMGYAAAAVHGFPSRALELVGITGTNGKTTTAQMLGAILTASGRSQRTLGTLSGARTTPEATDLQRRLAEFVRDGVESVVMEVSSHAMVYHRVVGAEFDVVVFTNLGRDHLDLHESMESYFRAKASLFDPAFAAVGASNVDDLHGRLLVDAASIEVTPFGLADAADVEVGVAEHSFTWRGHRVHVPIGGGFNVLNSLAALTAASLLGLDPADAASGLGHLAPVPGRFETVSDPRRHRAAVVVDYAHTPDGLQEVLRSARRLVAGGRVIAVFGCAGDRDVEKRAPMGAVGGDLADVAIVTSDNPRSEDPQAIVDQVVAGVAASARSKVRSEVDRRAAMADAIRLAGPDDIVVIAGKGHEATQTIGDEQRPFDDRVVARELLDELATIDMTGDAS